MSGNRVDDLNNNNNKEDLNNNGQEIDPATGQPRAKNEQGTSPQVSRRTERDPTPNDIEDDAQNGIIVTRPDLERSFEILEKQHL
ncbi:hypothetical protein K7X08_031605 [Anisodus acutangulus]|uniref:Uncharacterized protein n=1 Tax=Anisodus acutangulus TaxID=402998 RepID=A0A9Q1MPZ8_9SOLA|nr:hypothetical protein K7X08_031605 [Anisodus acutangulus]